MDVISGWIGSVTKRKDEPMKVSNNTTTMVTVDDQTLHATSQRQQQSESHNDQVVEKHQTQHLNQERDEDASTPTSTGSGSFTSGPDSEPASISEEDQDEKTTDGNAATALADEFENVSNKAIQSAKTFGNFLFSVANKAGKSVTETAKQIKTTVEENTILSDFNREQENFAKEKRIDGNDGSSCSAAVPPWVGYNDEDSMKRQIFALSSDKRNFLRNPPSGVKFVFDFDSFYPIALATLNEDPNLQKMRFELVPKNVNEETFWRNYFYRVSLIKQSTQLTSLAQESGSTGESSNKSSRRNSRDETSQNEGDEEEILSNESPNHEFVSDSYSQNIDMEDIKKGMKQLGVVASSSPQQLQPSNNDEEWEKALQEELKEYEVVNQGGEEGGVGNVDDPEWEREMESVLSSAADSKQTKT